MARTSVEASTRRDIKRSSNAAVWRRSSGRGPGNSASDRTRAGIADTRPRRLRLIVILGTLTALGPFTMDLYLPAFPSVATELATTEGAVQITLTATAIGLGIGQLIVGPWSDRIGRRTPLVAATSIHVVASIGVAMAPSIELVALMRFGQGFGAAASAVVASAMVRDVFAGHALVQVLARIALINGLAPIVAPVLGSQLLRVMDWRGVFWLLAGYGLLILIAAVTSIPETMRGRPTTTGAAATLRVRLAVVLGDRVFVGATIVGGMVFASIITYLSTSPFVFQGEYGLDAQGFGLLFAIIAVGLFAATQCAARLMRKWEPAWLLAIALPVLLLAGVSLVVTEQWGLGLIGAALPCLLLVATCGFCGPCVQVLVLERHPREAGTASAVSGFANTAIGGIVSPIPGFIGALNGASIGVTTIVASGIAMIALWIIVRPATVAPLTRNPSVSPSDRTPSLRKAPSERTI